MVKSHTVSSNEAYARAIVDLRNLLAKIGRHDFRAYGFARQLRAYRSRLADTQ